MTFYENWREILRKAWSIRLMLLAGVLSGIEVVLPLFGDVFTRGVFALLSFAAACAGVVARLVAQKGM